MFIGHYAAAFALKGVEKKASLGMLFIATQFVDILFFPFVVTGIERLTFVKDYTEVNNFYMDYYPFTHSLLGSILWGFLFYLVYKFLILKQEPNTGKIALVMGLAVVSHWFTDLIVHTADLPLFYGKPKYGFGLWNYKNATFITEAVLLLIGFLYYLSKTKPITKSGNFLGWLFLLFLILINFLNLYVLPANEDIGSLTVSALIAYFLFALLAHFIDKKRA